MQVQAVNQHAVVKYREFEWAMQTVCESLEATQRLVNAMSDQHTGRFEGWQVPTKKEVQEARRKAVALLDGLRKKAKEYEAELLSRGWRV
jgi:vacuolar-type H+-ATPase subunit D/Vma8